MHSTTELQNTWKEKLVELKVETEQSTVRVGGQIL